MTRYESWGPFPKATHDVIRMKWRDAALRADIRAVPESIF
jgi:hypothetical protein